MKHLSLLLIVLAISRCVAFTSIVKNLAVNPNQHFGLVLDGPATTALLQQRHNQRSLPSYSALKKSSNHQKRGPPRQRQQQLAMTIGHESTPALAQSLLRYDGNVPILQAFLLNALGFLVLRTKLLKMLTLQGYFHAWFLGTMLWHKLGWRGWTLTVLYLFLGSAVTKVRFADKQKRGIAESRGGRRGPENLWGSAATGLICVISSKQAPILGISSKLFELAYVASMATKLADTFASEIGKAYGKTTFLITTFERVEPGTEGAISAEGTAAAFVGGLLLSLYGWAVGLINGPSIVVASVAAFLATNVESLLGATLQGKEGLKWITNEMVNFFNTLIGASLAIAGGMIFP